MESIEKVVKFRFLGKVIEAEVVSTFLDDNWGRECYRLKILSGEHAGELITVPVEFTFAYSFSNLLHIGNKVKYVSGDSIFRGQVIDVNNEAKIYTIEDLDKETEVFYMDFDAFGSMDKEDGYYLERSVKAFRESA